MTIQFMPLDEALGILLSHAHRMRPDSIEPAIETLRRFPEQRHTLIYGMIDGMEGFGVEDRIGQTYTITGNLGQDVID